MLTIVDNGVTGHRQKPAVHATALPIHNATGSHHAPGTRTIYTESVIRARHRQAQAPGLAPRHLAQGGEFATRRPGPSVFRPPAALPSPPKKDANDAGHHAGRHSASPPDNAVPSSVYAPPAPTSPPHQQ